MTDFVWTDDAIAALRAMLDMGQSRGEVALALSETYGVPFSRNAIIGKAARLGIKAQPRPVQPRKVSPRPRGPYKPKAKPPAPLAPPERVEWRTIGIMELRNDTCRWMTAAAAYCGDPTADLAENRPYCPHHHAIAYRQPTHAAFVRYARSS